MCDITLLGGDNMAADIYENVFIGNFVFILGAQIGMALRDQKQHDIPMCINLLQQTPVDKLLGDMLADFPGCSFLIEFKREQNNDRKEKRKLDILRNALKRDSELENISRLAHWFIQIKDSKDSLTTNVVPYLDMEQVNMKIEHKSFEFFIKEIVIEIMKMPNGEDVKTIGVSSNDMSQYLKLLKKAYGSMGVTTGGIIINLSKNGTLSYAVINDISKTHKKIIEEYKRQRDLGIGL